MQALRLIARLEHQSTTLLTSFREIPDEEIRWKPAPSRWSALEVLGHLLDEERDDFRPRIRATLQGAEWTPIDPEARVIDREHQARELEELLVAFEAERADSVAWLRTLHRADWGAAHDHPQLGRISAGDLLASWVAHDLIHLQQIARLRVEWLGDAVAPFSIRYAAP